MKFDRRQRARADALLGIARAGDRVRPIEASPEPSSIGAQAGFAYDWDDGAAQSSVYLFESYEDARAAEDHLTIAAQGRGTVNGALLLWMTGDSELSEDLLGSFAGQEAERD